MKRSSWLIVTIAMAIVFFGSISTIGATSAQAQQAQSEGFTISPPSIELQGAPGQTITQAFEIANNSDQPDDFATEVTNFTAGGPNGDQPIFTPENTGYEMAPWMRTKPSEATIGPNGATTSLTLTIQIPPTASPGTHMGGLTIHKAKLSGPGNVKTDPAVTAVILVNVAGQQNVKLRISDFSVRQSSKPAGSKERFASEGPSTLSVNLRNDGNVAQRPNIKMTVKPLIGKKTVLTVNDPGNTLPQSNRRYETTWNNNSPIGWYSLTTDVTYDNGKGHLTRSTTLIAAPLWLQLVIALVALGIISTFVVKKLRRKQP